MRVAVFVPLYPPARLGGGPIRTLTALVKQQPDGFMSLVFTADQDLGRSERLPVSSNRMIESDGGGVYYVSADRPLALARGYVAVRRFRPDIVYINGFFNPKFSGLVQLLAAIGFFRRAKVLLAPRGEFSEGALALKSTKKHRFLRLHRLLRLDRQVLWHASTDREKDDIRRVFGNSAAVVVREDETMLPDVALEPTAAPSQSLRLAFLARITEKKGLHVLLEALQDVERSIDLSIFGSAEDPAYFAKCERLMKDLPSNVRCAYEGWLEPDEVRDALADFDLLANPTSGENFGHVIAEALSVSCPVMCADVTPWTSVLAEGGGVLVQSLASDAWTAALEDYAGLTPDTRLERRIAAGGAFEGWKAAGRNGNLGDDLIAVATMQAIAETLDDPVEVQESL